MAGAMQMPRAQTPLGRTHAHATLASLGTAFHRAQTSTNALLLTTTVAALTLTAQTLLVHTHALARQDTQGTALYAST